MSIRNTLAVASVAALGLFAFACGGAPAPEAKAPETPAAPEAKAPETPATPETPAAGEEKKGDEGGCATEEKTEEKAE
jgi:hypothetical protein